MTAVRSKCPRPYTTKIKIDDLATFMSKLPEKFQDILRRRQTHSITEISRDLGIPRTTLNDWMVQIRKLFEEAGFDRYLES
ncbi:MAG: hypothetical protein MUF23_17285 [Pirellula sp.]|nr:hypothetical protein [Pirellula sp.]